MILQNQSCLTVIELSKLALNLTVSVILKGVHAGAALTVSTPGSWRKKLSDRKYLEFWFAGRENVTPLLARFNELRQQPEVRVQTEPLIMRNMTLPPPSPRGLASREAAALA